MHILKVDGAESRYVESRSCAEVDGNISANPDLYSKGAVYGMLSYVILYSAELHDAMQCYTILCIGCVVLSLLSAFSILALWTHVK